MRLLSGARVVAKAYPGEKVGVFAVDDAGRAAVVEYSEMDPKEAASVDPDTGALSLCARGTTEQLVVRGAALQLEQRVHALLFGGVPGDDVP